jgi:hypothetical protein
MVYLTFGGLSGVPGLVHGVSTRAGGTSAAPFDSMNMGFHVGDDASRVVENRRRFVTALGWAPGEVVTTRQVHGTRVRVAGRGDAGRGALVEPEESWGCDALVTRERGILLMAFAADCPLVMLADAESGVAGLAHVGWRSGFGGILAGTLEAMKSLGARAERVAAAISPAIGPCCYEVGVELKYAAPVDEATSRRVFREHGEKLLLDLGGFSREMLKASGVREERIESADLCTRCHPEMFFSARRSPRTGRQAAVIGWREMTEDNGKA